MKEIISAVFKELSEAPAAIIDAYNKMKKKRAENLESKKEEARGNYEEMSNSISAKSKLEGLNSKTALASMGLNRSGESVQAQLINDMGTKNALADANGQYRREVQGLEDEHEKQELNAEKELKVAERKRDLAIARAHSILKDGGFFFCAQRCFS